MHLQSDVFCKEEKRVRQRWRLFQFCTWEGFVFSITTCIISCISEGQSFSCPVSHRIQVRSIFMVLNVKVPLDFMTI